MQECSEHIDNYFKVYYLSTMKRKFYFYRLALALVLFGFKGFSSSSGRNTDKISRLFDGGGDSQMSVLITMSKNAVAEENWPEALRWFRLYDKRLRENGQTMAVNKECCQLYIYALNRVGEKVKAAQYKDLCFSLRDVKNQEKYLEELAFISQYKFKDIHREEISNPGSDEFGLNFISDRIVVLTTAKNFRSVGDMSAKKRRKKYAMPKFVDYSSVKDIYIAEYYEGRIFKPETLKGDVNTDYAETTPVFCSQRKELYFSRTVPILLDRKNGRLDEKYTVVTRIFKAVYDNLAWRVLGECDIKVGKYSAMHPAISPDGTKMYFSSDMPSGYGGFDIYEVDIYRDGSFGKPVNLGASINSPGNEVYLNTNESGDLFFASDGLYGYGGFDMFVTYLEESPFVGEETRYHAAINLGYPVNTFYDDFGFSCAPDGVSCFFSSNRPESQGNEPGSQPGEVDLFSVQIVGDIFLQAVPLGTTLDNLRNVSDKEKTERLELRNPLTGALIHGVTPALSSMRNKFLSPSTSPSSSSKQRQNDYPRDVFKIDPNSQQTDYKEGPVSDVSLLQQKLSAENILKLSVVYFDFGKTVLNRAGKKLLDNIALVLSRNKNLDIEIQGHTDDIGPGDFNHSLSLKRAIVAKKHLISRGIESYRLTVKGFGETKPKDPKDRSKNRRVEFEVQ
jgi:outer membrane protein OmpA-like peptidoglycan-associated protein